MVETVQERESIVTEIQEAVRHSAVYGLGNVLVKAIGFFMLPFYTHYLNPVDYGVLEILDLSMSLLGMVMNMGITAALLRSYGSAKTQEEKKKSVSTAFIFVFATGSLTFFFGLGLVRPISSLLFGPSIPATYLLISFGSLILSYISNLSRTYLRALEASGAFTSVDVVTLCVMLSLNIYFIAVLKIGLMGLLLGSLIAGIIQVVVLSAWTLRQVGTSFSRPMLKEMVKFGLPLIFSNLAIFALNFSDRFFLQHLRTLEVVGIYAVGYKFGFMMNYLLVQPFYIMWQSRMYVVHARPDHQKIYSQIFVLYGLLLTFAGLALSMFSPEIVHLMVAPKFYGSQSVIPIVVLAYICYGLGYYSQLGMFLANRTNLIGWVSAAAAVLNLGLNYVLILRYGMMGAAWATLLSFLAIWAASYWCAQRVFPLPLGMMRMTIAILLAVGFYLLSYWWSPASLWMDLLVKGLLLAVFPIALWQARILSASEVGTLAATRDKVLVGVSRLLGMASRKAVSL